MASRQFHFTRLGGMYYGYNPQQPLLTYSDHSERASFIENSTPESSMPRRRRRGGKRRKGAKRGKKALKGTKGLRFSKGRLSLRLAGFGVQKLGASELVKFIPLSKLKAAAKKVLRGKGTRIKRKRRTKKRKNQH